MKEKRQCGGSFNGGGLQKMERSLRYNPLREKQEMVVMSWATNQSQRERGRKKIVAQKRGDDNKGYTLSSFSSIAHYNFW